MKKIGKNRIFAKYGSLEALDGGKILLRVVGTICPPGKPHSVKKKFELFLGCLSSGGNNGERLGCSRRSTQIIWIVGRRRVCKTFHLDPL